MKAMGSQSSRRPTTSPAIDKNGAIDKALKPHTRLEPLPMEMKTRCNYIAHCNVSEEGTIKACESTTSEMHKSQCFTDLISGTKKQVYADRSYLQRFLSREESRFGI